MEEKQENHLHWSKSSTEGIQTAIASMASVAKLPYRHAEDGISYTFSIVPKALGKTTRRTSNLVWSIRWLLYGFWPSHQR